MIGSMGVIALAAHQVALTCTSVSFMIPLGVAMAITVRMGEAAGASGENGGRDRLRKILLGGWMYGLVFAAISMFVFVCYGAWLAEHIVSEPAVVDLAVGLLVIAGLFQFVDGSQVISSSALRGMGDVKVPAWMGAFSYWVVGVPVGASMAFLHNQGAHGVWWGLAVGLGTAAVLLGVRAWRMAGRG